jgi:hypothetical protein
LTLATEPSELYQIFKNDWLQAGEVYENLNN